MEYLNWIAEHPFITIIALYFVCCALERKPTVIIKGDDSNVGKPDE
jgi:hypothetical protein